jgi:hypothetical protein
MQANERRGLPNKKTRKKERKKDKKSACFFQIIAKMTAFTNFVYFDEIRLKENRPNISIFAKKI